MPERIQLSRAKGWRMPEGSVKVDRSTPWGNPFRIGAELAFPFSEMFGPRVRDRAHAVEIFATYASITSGYAMLVRRELAGKSLACWCPLALPCHSVVLLAIAAGQSPAEVEAAVREQLEVTR